MRNRRSRISHTKADFVQTKGMILRHPQSPFMELTQNSNRNCTDLRHIYIFIYICSYIYRCPDFFRKIRAWKYDRVRKPRTESCRNHKNQSPFTTELAGVHRQYRTQNNIRTSLPMNESQCMDSLNRQQDLCDVEPRNIFRKDFILDEGCHQISTW